MAAAAHCHGHGLGSLDRGRALHRGAPVSLHLPSPLGEGLCLPVSRIEQPTRNPPMNGARIRTAGALVTLALAVPLVACKTKAADPAPADSATAAPVTASAPTPPPSVSAADPTPPAPTPDPAAPPPPAPVGVAVAKPPPPPPPIVEVRPPPPGVAAEWFFVEGHHRWDGVRYVWERGHWERRPTRRGAMWVPGHWDRRPDGMHVWINGHWG